MNPARLRSRFGRKAAPSAASGAGGAAALPEAEPAGPAAPEVKAEAVAPDDAPAVAPDGEARPESGPAATPAEAVPPARGSRLVEGAPRKDAALSIFAGFGGRVAGAAKAAKPAIVPAAAAAALILSLGIGYAIGFAGRRGDTDDQRLQKALAGLQQTGQEVARLTAELKTVRGSVETLRLEREKSRGELAGKQAQLAEKVERFEKDVTARAGRLAEQVERLEKGARVQALSDRLDRLERFGTPVAVVPMPPQKPVAAATPAADIGQTGSLADPKKAEPDPRKTKIEGIFVRDIDDGFALIELRNGGYMDVAVGYTVPGIGRVEAIERRGRQWVVVTPKGYIGER